MRLFSSHKAIQVIQHEHDLLKAILHGMLYLTRSVANGEKAPDLRVFRAMLYYIKEFPDKVHHPKEDRYLFAQLRARTHQVDAAIDELETQHGQGDKYVLRLEHALNRFEIEGMPAFKEFADMVERYAAFYDAHMRLEEEQILPAAVAALTLDDWKSIDAAFAANADPLSGQDYRKEQDMQKLFSHIVNIVPAPIGVGAAN